jgi:hypothetical protein
MSNLPKLKVKWWALGSESEETTCDFEQARDFVFGSKSSGIIFAEGRLIRSYEELVQLAVHDQHKDKEMLNVTVVVAALEGG